MTLILLPLASSAQVSTGDGVTFGGTTRAKVSDLAQGFLAEFGEKDVPALVQIGRSEGADGKTTTYDFGTYRMTTPKGDGEIVLFLNVALMEGKARDARAKPRFADLAAAREHVRRYVSSTQGPWLSDDPSNTNGLYILEERAVSAAEATKTRVNGGRPYNLFRYGKRRAGYDFLIEPVYVEVVLDAASGSLASYRRDIRSEYVGSLNGQEVPEASAVAVANKSVAGAPTGRWLGWVWPNGGWGAARGSESRLAWIFAFGKKQVWVDARTGKVVGGFAQ